MTVLLPPPPILAFVLAASVFVTYELFAWFWQSMAGHEATEILTVSTYLNRLGQVHPWIVSSYYIVGLPLANMAFLWLGRHLWSS